MTFGMNQDMAFDKSFETSHDIRQQGLLSIGYLLLSDNIFKLINYIQISYWIAIAMAIAALFYLRIKMPDAPRPIKVSLSISFLLFVSRYLSLCSLSLSSSQALLLYLIQSNLLLYTKHSH